MKNSSSKDKDQKLRKKLTQTDAEKSLENVVNINNSNNVDPRVSSNATNYKDMFGYQVDPRTGVLQLQINAPTISGFLGKSITPSISFTQQQTLSSNNILGLPLGWTYNYSFIAQGCLFINGQQSYYLDDNYSSGLKYYKLKNLSFESCDSQLLPYNNIANYEYENILKFNNGENQYFDVNGRLICMDDRFGNHVLLYYSGDDNVYNSQITQIIDSYGQEINFIYQSGLITITYPKGENNNISFSYLTDTENGYLTGYCNPLGQNIVISNQGGKVRNDLVSSITYPNGLEVSYDYTTIQYYIDSSLQSFSQMDCVSSISETYEDQKRIIKYNYNPKEDSHNFTGYPTYYVNSNEDILLQSNDGDYRYITRVNDGILTTEHIYNFLHLELETKTYTNDDLTNPISHNINTYNGEVAGQYFPAIGDLPANYQTPVTVVNYTYNDVGEKIGTKVETDFDEHGNLIETRMYKSSKAENFIIMARKTSLYDTGNYNQKLQDESYEYDSDDKNITNALRIINTLTKDNKNIFSSINGSIKIINNQEVFEQDKNLTLSYDEQGRVTCRELKWANQSKYANILNSTKEEYQYNINIPVMTITKLNAQGHNFTLTIDTVTGTNSSESNSLGTTKYLYDNLSRRVSETDPLGRTTKWLYNDTIGKTIMTNANGYEKYFYCNGFGDRMKVADNIGGNERILSNWNHNNKGQLVSEESILGEFSKITYCYDNRGRLSTRTDSQNNINKYQYDEVRQIRTEFFNDYKTKTTSYNGSTNVSQNYSISDNESVISSATYNINNNVLSSTMGDKLNSLWYESKYSYDSTFQITSADLTGSDGIVEKHSFVRDIFGNKIAENIELADSKSLKQSAKSEEYIYDNLNQLIEEHNPLNQVLYYTYNESGLVETCKDYAGTLFSSEYYSDGRIKSVMYHDNNKKEFKKIFTYYPLTSLLKSLEEFYDGESQGSLQYSYAVDGQLISITYPDGKKTTTMYDETTNLIYSFTDISGQVTRYAYDNYGRISKLYIDGTEYSVDIIYYSKSENAAQSGLIKSIENSNGIIYNYEYDGFQKIKNIKITNSKVISKRSTLLNIEYTYDELHTNITRLSHSSEISPENLDLNYIKEYVYNSLNQLIHESVKDQNNNIIKTTDYEFDAASNITSEHIVEGNTTHNVLYKYDDDNKLLKLTKDNVVYNLSYDNNGNLTDDGLGNSFIYDLSNRLISYKNVDGAEALYTYYANNLRASKKIGSDQPIKFYYDHSQFSNITNEAQENSTTSYLMNGNERYLRIIKGEEYEKIQYTIKSAKDVIGILDDSNNFENTYNYNPYGDLKKSSEKTNVSFDIKNNPFEFTKEYVDSESGLIYLRTRYYNPQIKRFMTRDSAMLINRYSYCQGNPIMNIDPGGNLSWGWIVLGAVAGIVVTIATAGLAGGFVAAAELGVGGALLADAGIGAVSGVIGTLISNGVTDIGLAASHEKLISLKEWGISIGAGAAGGVVGAAAGEFASFGARAATNGIAKLAGTEASEAALGWSSRVASAVIGNPAGTFTSTAIDSAANGQQFSTKENWEQMGLAIGLGIISSGATEGVARIVAARRSPRAELSVNGGRAPGDAVGSIENELENFSSRNNENATTSIAGQSVNQPVRIGINAAVSRNTTVRLAYSKFSISNIFVPVYLQYSSIFNPSIDKTG